MFRTLLKNVRSIYLCFFVCLCVCAPIRSTRACDCLCIHIYLNIEQNFISFNIMNTNDETHSYLLLFTMIRKLDISLLLFFSFFSLAYNVIVFEWRTIQLPYLVYFVCKILLFLYLGAICFSYLLLLITWDTQHTFTV